MLIIMEGLGGGGKGGTGRRMGEGEEKGTLMGGVESIKV